MRRAFTRFDVGLSIVLAIGVLLQVFSNGAIAGFAKLVAYAAGAWLLLRLARTLLITIGLPWAQEHILWRLRNRLLVAYGFIALVPIVLIVTLAALMLYGILGQVALHHITSVLERRTAQII